ncbi:hypothetical protein [Comamonas antarctica]|uniref:hypothetical protein n=1 Tax=Comamonas antarctica TaxID=2743470 RepID=UPI0028E90498|nr:hypothetical protein [Comamonas antarctica]
MIEFTVSETTLAVQLQATAAFADSGAEASSLRLYDAADALLAVIVLTKPCGTITNGLLRLAQGSASGDQIGATGAAVRADWLTGGGDLVASGPVTDEAGEGPFILGGTAGTQLYAGGRVILGVTEIA